MFQTWGFAFNQKTVRITEKLMTACASFPLHFRWSTSVLYPFYRDRHLGCFSWLQLQILAWMRSKHQTKVKHTKWCHLDCPWNTRADTEALWSLVLTNLCFSSGTFFHSGQAAWIQSLSLSYEKRQSIDGFLGVCHFTVPLPPMGKMLGIDRLDQANSGDQEATHQFI